VIYLKGRIEKCGNSYHIRINKIMVDSGIYKEGEDVRVSKIRDEISDVNKEEEAGSDE